MIVNILQNIDFNILIKKISFEIELNYKNAIYGDFIFNRFILDSQYVFFKFILPNKLAITITYKLGEDKILIFLKNKNILEGKLNEIKINNYKIFILQILTNLNLQNKTSSIIAFYLLINLIQDIEKILKIKHILIHKINTKLCIKIFDILQKSFIQSLQSS